VALVDGFEGAFLAALAMAALGIVAALVLIRRDELEQVSVPVPEAEAAAIAA
jgi:hypothetical protein